jgi:hypothetical protein
MTSFPAEFITAIEIDSLWTSMPTNFALLCIVRCSFLLEVTTPKTYLRGGRTYKCVASPRNHYLVDKKRLSLEDAPSRPFRFLRPKIPQTALLSWAAIRLPSSLFRGRLHRGILDNCCTESVGDRLVN